MLLVLTYAEVIEVSLAEPQSLDRVISDNQDEALCGAGVPGATWTTLLRSILGMKPSTLTPQPMES